MKINKKIKTDYFELRNTKFYCIICQSSFIPQPNNPSNLRRHFQSKHNEVFKKTVESMNDLPKEVFPDLLISSRELSFLKFIVMCKLPLNILNSSYLKEFCNSLNDKIKVPTVYTIKKQIKNIAEKQIVAVKSIIHEYNTTYSFVLDCWAYNNKQILGVKIIICNSMNKLENYIIGFYELVDQCSVTILNEFNKCLNFLEVEVNEIQSITTDSCNIIIKFGKLLKNKNVPDITEFDNSDETTCEGNSFEYKTDNKNLIHNGCLIHMLQNVIKVAEKNIDFLKKYINLVIKIIKWLRTFSVYSDTD